MSEARAAIVVACLQMVSLGLTQGVSGNIAVRDGAGMLITPSGLDYDAMRPDQIAWMGLADGGAEGAWTGPCKPSSEWQLHAAILRARPECGAVVHTHSPFATALSMARRPIPACHYMIATFGGADVRCSGYATFGTAALAALAVAALDGRTACLLANHGMVALGRTLDQAMWRAMELETLARQYVHTLAIGGPVLLTAAEVDEALARFAGYGPLAAGGSGGA